MGVGGASVRSWRHGVPPGLAGRSHLTAREIALSGSIPLAHALPLSPFSLRTSDQKQDRQHDADAEQRVVRKREDCSERSEHKRTAPEENGADSSQESSELWLLPLGLNGARIAKRDLDVMRMR